MPLGTVAAPSEEARRFGALDICRPVRKDRRMFGGTHRRIGPVWRAVARLTLIAFALRALLPIGFMPDLHALQDGRFEIVLCTADGAHLLTVGSDGQPIDPDSSKDPKSQSSQDCPFGIAFAKALIVPVSASAMSALIMRDVVLPSPSDLALLPPAQGPPLGSRAPPIHLV